MARMARELKAKGVDVISLSLGEPDFDTPVKIKEAAKKAIDDNFSHYTPVSGYAELRKAVCEKFKRDNELDFSPDQIVVSTGAKQSIANLMLCLVDPGDEVIVPAPYWVTYVELVKLAGGIPVILPTTVDSAFKVTPEQLKAVLTPKSRAIIFSSPCNPTGSVYSESELRKLASVFASVDDFYVISDEIYEHINYSGKHFSIARAEGMRDKTIVVNGASKGFAMTGWRVGYIGAPIEVAQACDKMQGQLTSATCSIAQKAMQAAAEFPVADLSPMKDAFKKRRDLVYNELKNIPGLVCNNPEGAFYFFPEVSAFYGKGGIKDSTSLCMYLLEKAHVALVPGIAFGNDNHIRISYAASEDQLREAMKRIKSSLAELK